MSLCTLTLSYLINRKKNASADENAKQKTEKLKF